MDKVEKFKELLEKYENMQCMLFDKNWIKQLTAEEYSDLVEESELVKKQLIKIYEEKQEKPVIRCEELYVNINQKYGYEIQFINLKNYEVKTYKGTLSCKEKDGMLITDDFIFVKE